jgi:endonuclease/exonuclease/phosphatase family metal-dependent hydrolase
LTSSTASFDPSSPISLLFKRYSTQTSTVSSTSSWPGQDLHRTHQNDILLQPFPRSDRYGGTAIASRWPHRVVETLDLRLSDAPDVPWCTLAAPIPIAGEGELLFFATTAAWRLDAESARERQVIAITDADARHRQRLPTIIAGDFNATPDSASMSEQHCPVSPRWQSLPSNRYW